MFGILSHFAHKQEIRESKDEILLGEIVRAMSRNQMVAIRFQAGGDLQRVSFRAASDPILHAVHVTLDRKTGGSALSEALLGSKASLTVAAEVKNYLSDPDDLLAMYRTDLANLFKLPILGGIRLNHELNSVFATTTQYVEIESYVLQGDAGRDRLVTLLEVTIGKLRERLRPYKRA